MKPDSQSRIFGTGEMADLTRGFDWSMTSLGPVAEWPEVLLTHVNTMLASPQPIVLMWGPDLIQFYNDAFCRILRTDKHPTALGQSGIECWSEAWSIVGSQIEAVMACGKASSHENMLVPIYRGGKLEDAYFTYAYSPVRDAAGAICGTLVNCQETTAQQHLVESETAFATLADFVPQFVWMCKPDGMNVYFNQRWVEYTGLTVEESLGRGWNIPFHPDDQQAALDAWDHATTTGETYLVESRLRAADGSYRWFLMRGVPLSDAMGNIVRWFGTCTDIHDLKRAEAALRQSEKDLSNLFDQAPAFFAVLKGPTHIYDMTNSLYDKVIGHRPVLGRSISDALPETVEQGFVAILDRVYQTGEPFVARGMHFSLAGLPGDPPVERDGDWVYQPMRKADGTIYGIIILGVDVTDSKHKEKALREIDARYRALFDNNMDAIFLAVTDGRVHAANRAACEMLGMSEEEICRVGRQGISAPFDHQSAILEDRLRLGKIKLEQELIRADGTRIVCEVSSVILPGGDPLLPLSFVIARDITDRTKAEAALIQNEKLAAVGRLASSIAHEINNPLEAVTNLLYLAQSVSTEGKEHYISQAQEELARVANITTQTLRFHRQSTHATHVSLCTLLDDVVSLMRGRLTNTQVTLEKRFHTARKIVAFDGDLRQVFANLIGNAIDAGAQGGCMTLVVRNAHNWKSGEEGISVTVADNGAGMSEKTRLRIFEPFFTTKGSTGTGLGLWVTSGILQHHRAIVRVRSSQHPDRHGTIFWIFFPLNLNLPQES